MTIGRRGFITGLISLVAAPAIVRVGSLMPVKAMPVSSGRLFTGIDTRLAYLLTQDFCTELIKAYLPEGVSYKRLDNCLRFDGPNDKLIRVVLPL